MGLREIFRERVFWILFIVMVCAGAAEQGMSQWASAFAEMGLSVSKTVGGSGMLCGTWSCRNDLRTFWEGTESRTFFSNRISGDSCCRNLDDKTRKQEVKESETIYYGAGCGDDE